MAAHKRYLLDRHDYPIALARYKLMEVEIGGGSSKVI
jgi:hypothetical protein